MFISFFLIILIILIPIVLTSVEILIRTLTSNRRLLNLWRMASHSSRIVKWTHDGWASISNVLTVGRSFLAKRIIRNWTVRSVSLSLAHSNASIVPVRRTVQLLSHLSSRNNSVVNWSCRWIPWLSTWISRNWRSLGSSSSVYRRRLLLILRLLIRRTVAWTISHWCEWLHSILSTSLVKAFHSHIWNIWSKPNWCSTPKLIFTTFKLLVYDDLLFGSSLCYIIQFFAVHHYFKAPSSKRS